MLPPSSFVRTFCSGFFVVVRDWDDGGGDDDAGDDGDIVLHQLLFQIHSIL